ncbi:MAG TPA: amidohydrolase family protein [Myxococcota bacterium]|nr:amidohydrolase family protein [Myxococcota bacterium]
MPRLDYRAFDCDNHYYEAPDAFTRHVPRAMQPRCVQWAEIDGHKHHVVGGRLAHAVKNPTWNPIAKPGAMYEYFRGNPNQRNPLEMLRDREPLPAYYHDADARLRKMDEQELEAIWLFPTLGVLYEELLKHDTEAVTTLFRGFNRWLDEDWGVARDQRIFAAPYLTLADCRFACEELEWALSRGARVVVMRPSAIWTAQGTRSPADPVFDPFWARLAEAGIPLVVHAGDSGYTSHGYVSDGFSSEIGTGMFKPSVKGFHIERAAYDFLITLVYEKLFERFPNLRVASVENGSEFLPDMLRKLRQTAARMPGYYKEDPVETFRRHAWINPFWEDDVHEIVDLMGPERVIFGSDWPHIEGMPQPLDYLVDLAKFDAKTQRLILRDNVRELNTPRPA